MPYRVRAVLRTLVRLVAPVSVAFGVACAGDRDGGKSGGAVGPDAAGGHASEGADGSGTAGEDPFWDDPPRIYWGDLHTHSINSVDVFAMRTPILAGDLRSTETLCEFGRSCAQLDFWALTDHNTGSPARHWRDNVEAARACQARSDAEGGPVVFIGFEWQQSSRELARNFAHKNVIFRSLDRVMARALTPADQVAEFDADDIRLVTGLAAQLDPGNRAMYDDLLATVLEGLATPLCPEGVPSPELPEGCTEAVADPSSLGRILDEWGLDALVIPHGNTWGQHHDPGMSWAPNLPPEQRLDDRQRLVEIYSGHGSIEEWRSWAAALPPERDGGAWRCPGPSQDYLPCCWQAGEIVRARAPECLDVPASDACEAVVAEARQSYIAAGRYGINTIRGVEPEAWLDCGECVDCFLPTQQYRPGGSLHAGLTSAWFGEGGPMHWHWGFVGTTDSHAIGPGAGYKELREASDIFGSGAPAFDALVDLAAPQIFPEWRRQNSYYYGGGLTGVHAAGPDRDALFDALEARSTYATTGDRIDLWFDLEGAGGGAVPMGGEAVVRGAPRFVARVRGAPVQDPGCPDAIVREVGADVLASVCFGECFNPGDRRHGIDRVELVRLLPRLDEDEPIEALIADPLAVVDCSGRSLCTARFEDAGWPELARPALYYVRVIQEQTPLVNARGYRCEGDGGRCERVTLCEGGYRGGDDDCLEPGNERAWSSPIRVVP